MTARYAIYFAPAPGDDLSRLGMTWLGRDSADDTRLPQPSISGFPLSRIDAITESARRYGFHATLKPPFVLADGRNKGQLDRVIADFARGFDRIPALSLKVASLDGFLALQLAEDSPAVRNLAAACVRDFDSFRAPPTEAELARRRQAPLSALEEALLARWGYPYVMEAFRFHMTLTCRLTDAERTRLQPALRRLFHPVTSTAIAIDAVSLFRQDDRGRPFRLLRRYPFRGETDRRISTNASTDRSSDPSLTSEKTSPPST